MIKAPYNFVPLSEKVFFPPWAEQVSHDIPFSDGESGEIEITITAKSPIFIRDHKYKEEFCHYVGKDNKKHYYIPGSSIKGMVRNVLEIMSFSKMKFVDDKTYAVRDLSSSDNFYMTAMKNEIYCGWLFKDGNNYKIEDCGIPYRISYSDIEKKFPNFKKDYFLISDDDLQRKNIPNNKKDNIETGFFDNRDSPYKNSFEKYKLIGEKLTQLNVYNFSYIEEDKYGKEFVSFSDNGDILGKLVLTGHPSARVENRDENNEHTIRPQGKVNDFVFEEFSEDDKKYFTLKDEVFNNFKFAYFDDEKYESKEWTYWKDKLKDNEKVPVFFQKGKENEGKENEKRYIKHFGLSYLYKLPYSHTIKDGLYTSHKSDKRDLSEIIFGYADSVDALKGRVQFGHCISENASQEPVNLRYTLATPRASYCPIYIRQNQSNCAQQLDEYTTYMNNDFVLSGWKRYPIHTNPNLQRGNCSEDNKIDTCLYPIKRNSVFEGRIRFHNLKKNEIGALLSAVTLHNTPDTFHNIGMAKAFGLGKISINLSLNGLNNDTNEYIKCFEKTMRLYIDNWDDSSQLKELVTMATQQNDNNLSYMHVNNGDDSYAKNKNKKNFLCLYSQLDGVITKYISPYYTSVNDINFKVKEFSSISGKDVKDILKFAEEESINIENENSIISFDIAKLLIEYMD